MTDMRRTLLWVVFTMSLVLLWDAWNKHTGQPSIFGAPVVKSVASAPPASAPAPAGVPAALPTPAAAAPTPAGVPAASVAGTAAGSAAVPNAPVVAAEKVVIITDVVKATIDTVGGSIVQLELLKHTDQNDTSRNVRIFDQSAKRLYLAQTGLITSQAGVQLPNHLTAMKVLTSERKLADGISTNRAEAGVTRH